MTKHNEDFQHYVAEHYVHIRGYEPCIKFPSMCVQERLPEVVLQLQLLEHKKYITSLENSKAKHVLGYR
jgi:hypothetical protein